MTNEPRDVARSRRIDGRVLDATRRLCGRLEQAYQGEVGLGSDASLRHLGSRLGDVLSDWGFERLDFALLALARGRLGDPFATRPEGPLFIDSETFLGMEALLGAIPTLSSTRHHLVGYGPEMPKVVTLTERILVRAPAPPKPVGPPWDVRLDESTMVATFNGQRLTIAKPDAWRLLVALVEETRALQETGHLGWVTEKALGRKLGRKVLVKQELKDHYPLLGQAIESRTNRGCRIVLALANRNGTQ